MKYLEHNKERPEGFDFDPEDFLEIDSHDSFECAAHNAHDLAKSWGCVTKIERLSFNRWVVKADSSNLQAGEFVYGDVLNEYAEDDKEEESDEAYSDRMWEEEFERTRQEIAEETNDYRSGLSRSNEDGWFYSDD